MQKVTDEVYAPLNSASKALLEHYMVELNKATKQNNSHRILVINSIIASLVPQILIKKIAQ